ncbi:MAG: hypothetical protein N2C12_04305 [Planctomycetales bacterium]
MTSLFYADPSALGTLSSVPPDQVPEPYRRLLVHQEHMTVAMEACHESLVDVEVLDTNITATHYARKILLRKQTDSSVVQFGIMRVDLTLLSEDVRAEIEKQQRPLGRILVRNNVLRTVHLSQLWKVTPGTDLQKLFNIEANEIFGRTAAIDLEEKPAVEVLEIVAPLN